MTYNNPNIESLLKIIFSLIDCRIISIDTMTQGYETNIMFLIYIHNDGLKYINLMLDLCKELHVSIKISHDFKQSYMQFLEIKLDQTILSNNVFKLNEFETILRLQGLYNSEAKIFVCDF